MSKLQKFKITSVLIIFVGLLLCTVITVAWFSSNKVVESNGATIKIEAPDGISIGEYYIFKRDGKDDAAKLYADYNDDTSFTFDMTEYDTVFTDRNVNTPVIIKVVLKDIRLNNGELPNINCTIETNKILMYEQMILSTADDDEPSYVYQKVDEDYDDETYGEYQLALDLSNILSIRVGAIAGLDNLDNETQANDIFDGVRSTFNNDKTTYPESTFIDLTKTTSIVKGTNSSATSIVDSVLYYDYYYEKSGTMTFRFSNDGEDGSIPYTIDSDNKAIVYFEFDYCEVLIQNFINQRGISVDSNANKTDENKDLSADMVYFLNDLKTIRFTYGK